MSGEPVSGEGATADPALRPHAQRMNSADGLTYFKSILDLAESTDRFLFEITRNNLFAFGALSVFCTTSIFDLTKDIQFTIVVLCVSAIVISIGSAILTVYYYDWSVFLYDKAWMIEKAWLRGKRGDVLAEELREKANPARPRVPRPAWLPQVKWPRGFYFWANLMPGLAAGALLLAVAFGLIHF